MRQLRILPSEQGIQILAIAFTAYAGEINAKQVFSAKFYSYLGKLIKPANLIAE
ncbi:MAG: hypothetical protein V7K50_29560 [Nostoc sp.]|uniref:hypothetical protein n=1 Tax=Nostoc sp. TaxID=1180 RepID=UPI002FFC811B